MSGHIFRSAASGGRIATGSAKVKSFSCVVKPTRSGVYKFSIQVVKGETVISRDPPIVLW